MTSKNVLSPSGVQTKYYLYTLFLLKYICVFVYWSFVTILNKNITYEI